MSPADYHDDAFIREFLAEAEEHFETLDRDLLTLDEAVRTGTTPGQDAIENMFRAVHTIKGLAAMLDYAGVRDLAHALENVLDGVRKHTVAVDATCLQALFDGSEALKSAMEAALGKAGADSDLVDRAMSAIDDFLGAEAPARDEGADDRLSAFARTRIAEAADEGLHPVRLRLRWGIELRLGALKLASLERSLGQGEVLDIRPLVEELPAMDAIDADATDVTVEVIALTDLSNQEIADSLGVVASAIEMLTTEDSAEAEAAAADTTAHPGEESGRGAALGEHIVRVSISRLDDLMDLTGEIVTARTRLDDLTAEIKARDPKDPLTQSLAAAVKEIGGQIDVLQEYVMGLRMVPVRQLFSKFPRTVRDLAHRSGKQIRLATEGERTELDKRLIEQIEDSVLHMIRNACDHGIESPQTREAASKPATGTITLAARSEGNHVVIEVSDDGAGLDLAAIWRRAVESGLISAEAEMDRGTIADLIMRSGFSTATEVTDVSGRGVGMDVVRQRTAELGGTVNVASEPGAGTTFTLRLPMTLAILPSLLVRENEHPFALPLAAVSEVLRVSAGDVRRLRGMHVMDLRGETLPVVRLGTALGMPEVKRAKNQRVFVIVVAAAGQRLGVMVDRLDGQQSVVVKNLEKAVGSAAGVSGATILGDGSVVPIVDVDGLVDLVIEQKSAGSGTGGGTA